MKSFSDFAKKTQAAEKNITRDKFYKNEVYKKGEWVLTEAGQVGKILRRGPNYVLCLTAEETTFRTWITDIKEVFEIGTDAYREYVMSLTPGQKVQKPSGTVAVKQVIPTDPKKDKMSHHEEKKSLAQLAAETSLNTKFKSIKETWRYDYSATIGNTDIKGKGADGVGGGDAPGMKLAEPKGEEGKPEIKKVKHSCATKVEHAEWGKGNCLSGEHTLLEDGTVTHYDVMFEHGLEKNVAVEDITITKEAVHEHVTRPEGNMDQEEVNTDLPAGPHGQTFVEPAIKSEGYGKGSKKKKAQEERSEVVGEEKKKKGKGKFWQDSDGDGKWYEKDDVKKEETVEEGKGLYANIHAKRKRGEKMRSKGDKGAPSEKDFKDSAKTAKKESLSFAAFRSIAEKK